MNKTVCLFVSLAFSGAACVSFAEEANTFRVTPYVQHPAKDAISLLWLAQTNGNASVSWWVQGGAVTNTIASATEIQPTDRVANSRFTANDVLQYCRAPEFGYDLSVESGDNYPTYQRETVGKTQEGAGWSMPYTVPYQYRVRLTGLQPGTTYGYRVTLADGASYEKVFRTAPATWKSMRFVYYSDSETEPADNPLSTGRTTDWTDPESGKGRTYYATQTEAYATNVARVVEFKPDLIVMSGDLAQKGSRQCDWDEFWRHNAGPLNDPAGSIPIVASPGNHDYWSYLDGGEVGMKKYMSYFEYEPNGAAVDDDIQERFHRVDYGPATFLFMDANNGDDSDYTKDTNRYIARNDSDYSPYTAPQGRGCRAPDFNPGSAQYNWLETQLADAQKKSAFIFVVSHQCPYSVGDHGQPNVADGASGEILSGRALRVLEPLFHKYGVTAWLCGHDEMMERSTVTGTETCLDGTERPHTLQIWDMGIAGDGLRGGMKIANPQEAFRACTNSTEVYDANGVLTDGGKHYGHLEISLDQRADGAWVATFDPVYEFFTTNAQGQAVFGGTRHYADKVTIVNTDTISTVHTTDIRRASHYVQDGLVAHFDAIENAGAGLHDDAPTVWTSLIGTNVLTFADTDSVAANSVLIGKTAHDCGALFEADTDMTIEFCAVPVSSTDASGSWNATVASVGRLGLFGWDGRAGAISVARPPSDASTARNFRTYASGYSTLSALISAGVYQTYSAIPGKGDTGDADSTVYVNAASVASTSGLNWTGGTRPTDYNLSIGSARVSSRVRAIRIYNRKLTAAEVAQNRAEDVKRFDQSLPEGASLCTWTGAGNGTKWSDAANWESEAKPKNGDVIVLSGHAANAALENDIADLTTVSSMTLKGANSFSVSGNALALTQENSFSADPAAGVTYTFAVPLTLNSSTGTNVLTKAGSGELKMNGKLSGAGALRLALGWGNIARANNSYSGNILRLNGANDYTGGTDIVNGGCMVILGHATALGSGRTVRYGGNSSNAYVAFNQAGPYDYDFVFTSTSKSVQPNFFAIYGGTTTINGGLTADIAYSNEVRFVGLTNSRSLTFKKKIVAPGLALFSGMTYTAYLTFEEGIDVRQWKIDTDTHGNSSGFNRLYGTDNRCNKFIMGYGTLLCAAENVLVGADFDWSGYMPSGTTTYNWDSLYLQGFDQTVGTISGNKASGVACGVYSTTGTPTLTEQAKASATAYLLLGDHVSFVYDPQAGGLVQNFTNRTHTTDGTITVKGGTLAFTGATLLQNVPTITVEEDAAFVLSTTQTSALLGLTSLNLGTNATFTVAASDGDPFKSENVILEMEESSRISIPAGLSLSVRELWIDGVQQEGGATISGIPQITGGGSIRTADIEVETKPVTWTANGADALVSTLGNWTPATTLADLTAGGLYPTFGNDGDEAIVDRGVKTVGVNFNRAFTLKGQGDDASLLVKDDGLTFTAGDYAVTNEVATKIKFDQTWDISSSNGVTFVQKGEVSSDSAFKITKSGKGELRFTGDNSGFCGDFRATDGEVWLEGTSNGLGRAAGAAKAEFDAGTGLRLAGCVENRPILLHACDTGYSLQVKSGTNVLNGALTSDTSSFTPTFAQNTFLRTNGKVDPSNKNAYIYGYGEWHIAGPIVIGYFEVADYMRVIFDSPAVTTCTGGSAYLYLANPRAFVRFDRPMQLNYRFHWIEMHFLGGRVDLNGNDQNIGTLKTNKNLYRNAGYPEPYIGSSSGPATLFFEQWQSANDKTTETFTNSIVNFTGHLSLNKTGALKFTLNRPVDTDGALVVSNGLFEITKNGSWRNGTRVVVGSTGSVSIGQSKTFAKSAVFTAGGNGRFVLEDGVRQRGAELWIGGVKQPSGTYGATGSGAQYVDDVHFAGKGVLDVGVKGLTVILR